MLRYIYSKAATAIETTERILADSEPNSITGKDFFSSSRKPKDYKKSEAISADTLHVRTYESGRGLS